MEESKAYFDDITSIMKHSTSPSCLIGEKEEHLTMDTACLEVSNIDDATELEFWAQSKECYTCPPWKYLTLAANASESLIMNSTYPTDVYIKDLNGTIVKRMQYHFLQYGDYSLTFDAEDHMKVHILELPQPEIIAIIMTIVFFAVLAFIWQCSMMIMRRMDSSDGRGPAVATERSPLLVSTVNVVSDDSATSQAGPSSVPDVQTSTSEASSSAPVQLVYVQEQVPDSRREGGRLISLDVFRGTSIILMIFVNYGGGKYFFFNHARWNGLTVADLVFPWFMWIMGVSLAFSIRSQLKRATKRYLIVLKILKRCIILFVFGIIINSIKSNYLPTLRILGVLQRFAFCYFITATIEVYCMSPQQSPEYVWYWKVRDVVRSWLQWLITIVLVIIHTTITFGLSVPGCPTGYLGPGGLHEGGAHSNCTGGASRYVDEMVIGTAHMYQHPTCSKIYDSHVAYDPEGLLGILTCILMVQFGVAAGRVIITHKKHSERLVRWLIWGTVSGLVAGFFCGWRKEGGLIPVNKNLWSLSFILTTNCFAFFLLSFLYLVIDKLRWWSGNPIRYVGMNAIVLYMGHEILGKLLPWSWTPVGNYHANHLVMNVWGASLWVVIAYMLHRKKVYVSI